MINPKTESQAVYNPKSCIYMPLAKVIKTITSFNTSSLETLTTHITLWMKQAHQFQDLDNAVLCIDATDAPVDFNYLALIRALTIPQDGKDVYRLVVSGIVVGGVPFDEEYRSSILEALNIISSLTRTSYLHWREDTGGNGSEPLLPRIGGLKLTGSSAVLVNQLLTKYLTEDYTQDFTYKLLVSENPSVSSSAASASLKTLYNKYPSILQEERIEVPRAGNKGITSSYKYKLIGFKSHEQTPRNSTQAVGLQDG